MNLRELIERLQSMEEQLQQVTGNDDVAEKTEVRIASQPSWPLAHNIEAISAQEESDEEGRQGPVLWLACSASVSYAERPYAPRCAWDDECIDCGGEEVPM